jgi:hypothetical protein
MRTQFSAAPRFLAAQRPVFRCLFGGISVGPPRQPVLIRRRIDDENEGSRASGHQDAVGCANFTTGDRCRRTLVANFASCQNVLAIPGWPDEPGIELCCYRKLSFRCLPGHGNSHRRVKQCRDDTSVSNAARSKMSAVDAQADCCLAFRPCDDRDPQCGQKRRLT